MKKLIVILLIMASVNATASGVKTLKDSYYVGIVTGNCMVLNELLKYRSTTAGPEERKHVSDFINDFVSGSGYSVSHFMKVCKKAKAIGERLEGEKT